MFELECLRARVATLVLFRKLEMTLNTVVIITSYDTL